MSRSIRAGSPRSKQVTAATEAVNRSQAKVRPPARPAASANDADSAETAILESIRLVNLLRLHLEREAAVGDSITDELAEQLRRVDALSRFLISAFSTDAQRKAS